MVVAGPAQHPDAVPGSALSPTKSTTTSAPCPPVGSGTCSTWSPAARPPAPDDLRAWLTLWTPEPAKGDTRCVTDRFARRHRPGAVRALTAYEWPENVRRLRRVVRAAASRADVVDVRHLPAEVLTGARHRLSRLRELERDGIARCLTEPGTTVAQAARRLGMSRATLHRETARYGIGVPGRAQRS
ncbi:helix-turn-helix domain-containing protein [Streptomyces salinarius]|uniref:helix-turn-helix domain-containing protein n=1 Tax=Streptomyces TaxID=1883 RepID=UPI001F496922|nr:MULTISPECIES: helix-turn-helix domain-containing protein [unclassified Streptomyces]